MMMNRGMITVGFAETMVFLHTSGMLLTARSRCRIGIAPLGY